MKQINLAEQDFDRCRPRVCKHILWQVHAQLCEQVREQLRGQVRVHVFEQLFWQNHWQIYQESKQHD